MYKTILVPHAGTAGGDEALKHAINIAKSNSSKIIILHIVEELPHVPLLSLHSSQTAAIRKQLAEIEESIKQEMSDEMSKKVSMCKKQRISSEFKISSGSPLEEIKRTVKNKKIDLIVMAKRRKLKGVKSLLKLGSVSRKVLENVSCPILMIDLERK